MFGLAMQPEDEKINMQEFIRQNHTNKLESLVWLHSHMKSLTRKSVNVEEKEKALWLTHVSSVSRHGY